MMTSVFRIDFIEAALLALLRASLPNAYGSEVDVNSLGDADFDEDGRLVLNPPATRVRFMGGDYNTLRDNQRLTYQAKMPFEILCFESSLRDPGDERKQTLVLVATVLDQLSGARLQLSDGTQSMPVTIRNVRLVDMVEGPVDQHFVVGIEVEGIAQFSGANAEG